MNYRTTIRNEGDDCVIIYHPSESTIRRLRLARKAHYILARIRAFFNQTI